MKMGTFSWWATKRWRRPWKSLWVWLTKFLWACFSHPCLHFYSPATFFAPSTLEMNTFSFCRTSLKLQRILPRSCPLKNTTIRFVRTAPSAHLQRLKAAKRLFCRAQPISLLRFLSFRSGCHQWELPGHVGHYLQSLTPPASCDAHQDRLEQDPELPDWQGDAERLGRQNERKKKVYINGEHNRQPPPPLPPHPHPNNVAWLDSCIVFVQKIEIQGAKESLVSPTHWMSTFSKKKIKNVTLFLYRHSWLLYYWTQWKFEFGENVTHLKHRKGNKHLYAKNKNTTKL